MFAGMVWILAGLGGDPGLEEAWKVHEQGDTSAALEQVRALDDGGLVQAACVRAELAEILGEKVEAWRSVRRCLAHLDWEKLPSHHYELLRSRLRPHVTELRTQGDVPAWVGGEKITSWPLWVERGSEVELQFTSDGQAQTVEAWKDVVTVAAPPAPSVAIGTFHDDDSTTVNNYLAERPPGAFPLRKTTQIAGVVAGIAGAGLAGYGVVGFFDAQSKANASAEYTNDHGGCPDAGSRCEEYDAEVERRADARGAIITGGAVAGAGVAAVIVGAFLPKWIGGEASANHARLTFSGSF